MGNKKLLLSLNIAAAAAKSLQLCPTLCDPRDGSPPGSAIPGILQARTLEWAAISFSDAWKWKVEVKSHSHVRLFATPWTVAHQAPPSMEFSRPEYWSGLPFPSPKRRFSPENLLSGSEAAINTFLGSLTGLKRNEDHSLLYKQTSSQALSPICFSCETSFLLVFPSSS